MVARVITQTNKGLSWGTATLTSSSTKDLNSDSVLSKVRYWAPGK